MKLLFRLDVPLGARLPACRPCDSVHGWNLRLSHAAFFCGGSVPMDPGESDDDEHAHDPTPDFYNADADARDDAFVRQLAGRGRPLITDGTLSCPSCFAVVCYECQQ